ncbi:MAG TPA: hypothetical protein VKK79_07700 [Candidatus Lokiarchaeia archaeon]|nr:hypothetical protein [Candidatus Lokiarchaeia archaeon]
MISSKSNFQNTYDHDQLKHILDASQIAWNPLNFKALKHTLRKGLYEVYFLMVTLPQTREAFWIRYTLLIPRQLVPRFVNSLNFPPSSTELPAMLQNYSGAGMLWFAFFSARDPSVNFAVKQPYALDAITSELWMLTSRGLPKSPEQLLFPITVIRLGNSTLWPNGASGSIDLTQNNCQTQISQLQWDLTFAGYHEPYAHVPNLARRLGLVTTIPVTIHPAIFVNGQVTFNDGEKVFSIENAAGTLTHIIGRNYAKTWAWAHCNAFEGAPGAFFELSCLGGLATFGIFDGTTHYYFNRVQDITKVKCHASFTAVDVRVVGRYSRVEGKIWVPPEFLLGVEYFGPAGEQMYCYNSEIASSEFKIFKIDRATREESLVQVLVSECTTAFETTHFKPLSDIPNLIRWEDSQTKPCV